MSLDDTETSSDVEPEGHIVDPVPEEYGGILDPAVRGDASGNVQTLKGLDFEPSVYADVEAARAEEDPYWRGYREAQTEFNLRLKALELAVGASNSPTLTWPENTTITDVATKFLTFLDPNPLD